VRRPKRRILGHELAGEIEAVGAGVTELAVGDRVFGALPYLALRTGAHAEYISVPASWPLAPIPSGSSYEQVGAISDGALCALNAYRPVGDLAGKRILVYGASGSIGTAGVQLGKHFGAHVTAVCNTKNVELVRSLGADEVIDYLQDDFTKNGETYDVVFDAVGKHSFRRSKGSLEPGGYYLPTDGFRNVFYWLLHKRVGERKVVFEFPRFRKDDVALLGGLVETGAYRPVVDRVYPLEDVVEATRYVETQQKTGNVVLAVITDD
jgi:NADPH:quinone reductase-like Zn-dependent oxidoreductase